MNILKQIQMKTIFFFGDDLEIKLWNQMVIIDSMFYGNTSIHRIIHNFPKYRIYSMYRIVNIEWEPFPLAHEVAFHSRYCYYISTAPRSETLRNSLHVIITSGVVCFLCMGRVSAPLHTRKLDCLLVQGAPAFKAQ